MRNRAVIGTTMMLEFGPFVLDLLQRQVLHMNLAVRMAPKAFELLVYFAQNAGRIVSKEELLSAVWPGVSVSESNLTQSIFLLRNALKTCDDRRYIVSVPGRGYQFAAEIDLQRSSTFVRPNLICSSFPNPAAPGKDMSSPVYGWLSKRTADTVRKAIRWSERTSRRDPNSAKACLDLANAYGLLMTMGEIPSKEAYAKIESATVRALERGPDLGAPFAALGFLRCHFDRDWMMAEQDFQRALDQSPDDMMSHHWYGEFLAARGRFDESLKVLNRALKRDPQSLLIRTDIALTLFFARDYKACEASLLEARELSPRFPRTNVILGSAYARQGRHGEAIRTLEAVCSRQTNIIALGLLAEAYSIAGELKGVQNVWHKLRDLSKWRYISPYALGFVSLSLGETERSLQYLDAAADEADYWLLWLGLQPSYDKLRTKLSFHKLLQKARLAA